MPGRKQQYSDADSGYPSYSFSEKDFESDLMIKAIPDPYAIKIISRLKNII
jgi:hypothetical protein